VPHKQIHLAAHFPGVNNTTVWSDPAAGSHIAFESFRHFAQTAERAKFDFLFLAEGLRLREQGGKIYDLDVVGRPDNVSILMAMAAVTQRIGLAGTVNSTFNEPLDVARKLASLDHLSGGRAAWNVVTSWDEFTGENFRRGGYLPKDKRYLRAQYGLTPEAYRAKWNLPADYPMTAPNYAARRSEFAKQSDAATARGQLGGGRRSRSRRRCSRQLEGTVDIRRRAKRKYNRSHSPKCRHSAGQSPDNGRSQHRTTCRSWL